ncbi:hypothetical protein E2C01_046261 [Portunus trituberculatus]|uniref:Uncharacterized protein n=1 Tax=Portunus trituberculatus TaxID=210409 RepID=A0A5B7G581_PORTR|nr:hypothetical protein [Portunus trituberculatus]
MVVFIGEDLSRCRLERPCSVPSGWWSVSTVLCVSYTPSWLLLLLLLLLVVIARSSTHGAPLPHLAPPHVSAPPYSALLIHKRKKKKKKTPSMVFIVS